MNETSNNRSERRKKAKNRKLMIIIVLLLLCLASLVYILSHFGSPNDRRAEEPAEETPAAEETAEVPEENADVIAVEKAASHVYSHRGSAGDSELSFISYDAAVEAGSKYIEADIVVSGSGTPNLARDDYAMDMTGYGGYFSGMADSQIDELKTKSGEKVLKLKDLFERYGDSVTYLVDIKYTGSRNTDAFSSVVKKYGYEDNVIATSSFFDVLKPLEVAFPDMTKLYVCMDQATFDIALEKDYVDIISVPKDLMTADNLKAAHKHDKKFSAWTLNSEKDIRKAIDLGVDTYFTDDSALAIELEKGYRGE